MLKLFGTDGIRGRANKDPITCTTINKIASIIGLEVMAGSDYITRHLTRPHQDRHLAVIGKDTRVSGYMLESAITAGLVAAGMEVRLLGPLPTPAIAWLTRSMRADLGIMVSASHNLYQDNGIKFFGPDGNKISSELEARISEIFHTQQELDLATPDKIGQVKRLNDAQGRYIEFTKSTFPKGLNLNGWKIVVDCANGANYQVAPAVLTELGAHVIAVANNPNGFNINDNCGATSPYYLQQLVLEHQADLGIAFDGDGDRVILCDEKGAIINGDHIMATIAMYYLQQDSALKGNGVVATVMSNLGLEHFLNSHNLKLIRVPVGDRYVSEYMRNRGFNLGGEQSGHIILSDYNTTGDGLIAALQVLSYLTCYQLPASSCRCFTAYPQLLENIKINSPATIQQPEVKKLIDAWEKSLHNKGRLLVRASGTEPLIRIMAEGEDIAQLQVIVNEIKEQIIKQDQYQLA